MWSILTRKRLAYTSLASLATGGISYYQYSSSARKRRDEQQHLIRTYLSRLAPEFLITEVNADAGNNNSFAYLESTYDRPHTLWTPPSRKEIISLLQGKSKDGTPIAHNKDESPPFDLLIVGGGATGTGAALDAATRGLKVALVERDDFAAGTSSRSTKLVHGGVRYLEKAFWELDYEQYKLVREALHERATFLHIAPHLSIHLPIMLPIYKWWQLGYYWVGSKAYSFLAGKENVESSYFLTRSKALEAFPMLKKDKLVGAMIYYDGQHNDARMNVAIALTAIASGAVIANHTEVIELLKDKNGIVNGARVRDTLTGDEWDVKAKGVINATGPFTDALRFMDNPKTENIVAPSSGVHVVLPNYYSPGNMGLVDPATSDGRVIFFLPWQGNTIAGTTDSPTEVTYNPMPKEEEVQWILDEIRRYLSLEIKVRRGDVLAAWSGIRPLVRDPSAKNSADLVRNHMIHVSDSKLITVAGGKWTTYRAMAEEAIDKAIEVFELKPHNPCITRHVKLIGSHGYSKTMFIKLIQQFGLETEIAQHLTNSYGDRAWAVAALAQPTGKRWPVFGKRLSPFYPYVDSEVRYAVRREYACTLVDVIARRTRLAFLNAQAALDSLPLIVDIMTEELGWSEQRQSKEYEQAIDFLLTMGLPPPKEKLTLDKAKTALQAGQRPEHHAFYSRSRFQPEELASFQKIYADLDVKGDGYIQVDDIAEILGLLGYSVHVNDVNAILDGMKLDRAGAIEFEEFLEVMSGIKEIQLQTSYAKMLDQPRIPIERASGGI
ncbi:11509_t:CDS:2 [Ambispora gerdemannii]|uniref:Glycerol-3-phosphate dehydrogenase n=1 Tax=Ambispora gerdemannii TaxID=144530 RepID=A0A9N9CPK1_9GLOM|nr:11509_t:CDS:2 [Ambispora gerdemannii]